MSSILYIITQSDSIGGASIHLLELALSVQSAGHKVTILTGGNGVFVEKAKSYGLKCITVKNMVREISPHKDFKGFFELKKIIQQIKPDLIHAHSSKAGTLARLVARHLRIPCVFTVHGWAFTDDLKNKKKRFIFKCIEKCMGKFTDQLITVSHYDRHLAIKYNIISADKVVTIHNGIQKSDVYHDYSDTAEEQNPVVRCIMVARFCDQKNHELAIRALAQIKDLPCQFEFVGVGESLDEMQALATELGIAHKVIFSGRLDNSQVVERLAQSDVFVLTSNWEGLPISIIEAMRAKLPIIASDVGGITELINPRKEGFLLNNDDLNEVANTFRILIENKNLRKQFGEAAYTKYLQNFSIDQMLNKTLALYDSMTKNSKS